MTPEESLPTIRRVFRDATLSSLHVAIASTDENGFPHVTPIGSMRLRKDGVGVFFEVFSRRLIENIERDPRVCVLAVNSAKRLWINALLKGQFASWPGIRLKGTVGARREASEEERAWWDRRLRRIMWTKGAKALWNPNRMRYVREISFTDVIPVVVGATTDNLRATAPLKWAERSVPVQSISK